MEYKIITSLDEAKNAWNHFSKNEQIYDVWEYRYCYYKFFNYPLHFISALENGDMVGLLPLQRNTDTGIIEFFGGQFFLENKIWTKPQNSLQPKDLLNQLSEPVKLLKLSNEVHGMNNELYAYRYELRLEGYHDVFDYLQETWGNKSRKNFLAQIKQLHQQSVEIIYDNFSDLQIMVEFNKKRFGNESSFFFPHRMDFINQVIEEFDAHLVSIKINGQTEAVGFGVKYNNSFIGINSGRNLEINSLGKFLSLQKIQQAISLGASRYDALLNDLGWKESFHFDRIPQYQIEISRTS